MELIIFAGIVLLLILFFSRSNLYTYIALSSYAKKDMDKAFRYFYKAKRAIPRSKKKAIMHGYYLLREGRLDEAENCFKPLYSQKMKQDLKYSLKSNHALIYWKRGNIKKSVSLLKSIYYDFKSTTIYGSLGYILTQDDNLEEALTFNKEAYDYNGENLVIADNYGYSLYLNSQYDKAEEVYKKLIDANPKFPDAFYNYALVKITLGDVDAALFLLNKALECEFPYLSGITKDDVYKKLEEIKST